MIELAIVCYITRRQNVSKKTSTSIISPILHYHQGKVSALSPFAQVPPYQFCLTGSTCGCCQNNNNSTTHSFDMPRFHESNVYSDISAQHGNTFIVPNDNGIRLRSFENGRYRPASSQPKERG